ncbi:hypothetical protein BKA65DRAFT_535104 [Rhexocercosporidium sp. MPI-PUGE-AT-0058]|nr:hypothetical protein BKA65DRAFT_535104 [Rhexocercosporidium sp. MPI-PUGE-AT-0058]
MTFMQCSFSFLVVCFHLGHLVTAQDISAQFNQVINLNGNMEINRITFPDNSRIETFSQSQQQLIVNQNPSPLTANHVVGSTGQPFVQLSQNSMTIATNNASNLVGAQIELPIDPAILQQNNISPDNAFVAMLSPGRQAWIVMEGIKSVNTTDNTVRLVKMTNIDGEYIAIGRQTTETANVLTPFATQSVNITGSGIQEVEFADGFRMSMKATQPMTLTTNVVNGISTSMITDQNTMSVNNYRYLVTTNLAAVAPNLNQMTSIVQMPLNMQRVMAMAAQMGVGANEAIVIGVSQRTVQQNPGGATGNLSPNRRVRRLASSMRASRPARSSATPAASAGTGATDPATDPTTNPAAADPAPTSDPATPASNGTATDTGSPVDSGTPTDPATETTPAPDGTTNSNSGNSQSNNPAATQLLLNPTFQAINAPTSFDPASGRVMVAVNQINGEFILTMQRSTAGATTQGGIGGNGTTGAGGVSQGIAEGAAGTSRASASGQGGITFTMAEITSLMEQQRMGSSYLAMAMMQAASGGSQI